MRKTSSKEDIAAAKEFLKRSVIDPIVEVGFFKEDAWSYCLLDDGDPKFVTSYIDDSVGPVTAHVDLYIPSLPLNNYLPRTVGFVLEELGPRAHIPVPVFEEFPLSWVNFPVRDGVVYWGRTTYRQAPDDGRLEIFMRADVIPLLLKVIKSDDGYDPEKLRVLREIQAGKRPIAVTSYKVQVLAYRDEDTDLEEGQQWIIAFDEESSSDFYDVVDGFVERCREEPFVRDALRDDKEVIRLTVEDGFTAAQASKLRADFAKKLRAELKKLNRAERKG